MKDSVEIACVGEAIVDLVGMQPGRLVDVPMFRKCAGGAAANVAVGLARLGTRSAFVGRVGRDPFGTFLVKELKRNGVDTRTVVFDPEHKTRLAFVSLRASGERDFEFWEKAPADENFQWDESNLRFLGRARIVHLSSFLLLKEPSRSAVLNMARALKQRGSIISFDPNIRISLWPSVTQARRVLLRMVALTTILRLNLKEARLLTGARNIVAASRELYRRGPAVVVITLGKSGSFYFSAHAHGLVPGFRVRAVDTTGCGDGFLAGLLHGILKCGKQPDELTAADLRQISTLANATGALTATSYGVFDALPDIRQVRALLRKQ